MFAFFKKDNNIPDGPVNGKGTIPNAIGNEPGYDEANPGENNAFEGDTLEKEAQNFIATVMGNPAILAGLLSFILMGLKEKETLKLKCCCVNQQ